MTWKQSWSSSKDSTRLLQWTFTLECEIWEIKLYEMISYVLSRCSRNTNIFTELNSIPSKFMSTEDVRTWPPLEIGWLLRSSSRDEVIPKEGRSWIHCDWCSDWEDGHAAQRHRPRETIWQQRLESCVQKPRSPSHCYQAPSYLVRELKNKFRGNFLAVYKSSMSIL